MEVARSVYQFEKDEPVDSDTFNFPVYIGYLFYNGFDKLGVELPWTRMEKYHRALKAVRTEIDIRLILKKILYF